MPSFLPILTPGRDTPINVPCELPDSFTFTAYLPSRGLRRFTAWLTSQDVREAEIKDVVLAEPERDPRGDEWSLEEDERRRADEAAGDVLRDWMGLLNVDRKMRVPVLDRSNYALRTIALAHEAECKAWETLRAAHMAVNPKRGCYASNPATERSSSSGSGDGWASHAANYLSDYVDRCLEDACEVQRVKAERQQAEHPRHVEDEDGSERIRAPRSLDAPTLKALSWDVDD